MSRESELQKLAVDILAEIQERASKAKKELLQIKTRQAQIDAELEAAGLANERFFKFQPNVGGQIICPRCWMARGEQNPLARADGVLTYNFRCTVCDLQVNLS